MTAPDVLELAAKLDHPAPHDWSCVIDAAERDFKWADHLQGRAELRLRALAEYADAIKPHRPNWETAPDDLAKELREIQRLRLLALKRAEARPAPAALELLIDVNELARQIGRTVGTTRRLLESGQISGAARKTPGVKNSPWLIPATSPARFLEGRS